MPDFAATLTTQAEQDANDDNVSFLRTPVEDSNDTDSDDVRRRRTSYMTATEFRQGQRRAMRRAVRRYTPAQLQELGDSHEAMAPDLAPRQSTGYQGWAPGSSDADEEESQGLSRERMTSHDVETHLQTTRRHQHERNTEAETAAPRRNHATDTPSIWEQSHFIENGLGGEPTMTDSVLRTTALLQSVRRHSRFSARSRDQLETYILERARRTVQPGEGTHEVTTTAPIPNSSTQSYTNQQHQEQQRLLRTRMLALQRMQDGTSSRNTPEVSRFLEEAIKYLERLRFCDTYSERISSAVEGGFTKLREYFTYNHEDFILDTTTIAAPPESSWLKVGGVFTGSQHAAGGSSLPSYNFANSSTTDPSAPRRAVRIASTRTVSAQTPSSNWTTHHPSICPANHDEQWPVKVTIHSIDYVAMTLSGTMEAFNVPDKSSPTHQSSITTFLEGEIIDFNKFTLETKSFQANPRVDGTYWRKLKPFKGLTDAEIVKNLMSVKWLSESLCQKWILMRWKGKCFPIILSHPPLLPFPNHPT